MTDVVQIEAQHLRAERNSMWPDIYSIIVPVPNNQSFPVNITMDREADFHCLAIAGSCYGPATRDGKRILNASTDFPLAGTLVPSGATAAAYAERGLMIQMTDSGGNRALTSGWVPAETFLTPGYGIQRSVPQDFDHLFFAGDPLRIDVRNRDTAHTAPEDDTVYHILEMFFYGFKLKI